MDIEKLREYCLSLGEVTEKTPFGKFAPRYASLLVFYVSGHMFAMFDMDDFTSVTVRSTPDAIEDLMMCHTSARKPHNPSLKYWVDLGINGDISDSVIREWIRNSYEIIRAKYS